MPPTQTGFPPSFPIQIFSNYIVESEELTIPESLHVDLSENNFLVST
jgi:hypothetical protein